MVESIAQVPRRSKQQRNETTESETKLHRHLREHILLQSSGTLISDCPGSRRPGPIVSGALHAPLPALLGLCELKFRVHCLH